MSSSLLYGRDDLVARWVAGIIPGCGRGWSNAKAIGVLGAHRELIAGVIYHDWSPETGVIEVSSAAVTPKWATRRNLTQLFEYPFSQLRCRIVVARISENNNRACRLWRAFGATEHKLPDLRAEGEAECVYLLTKDTWQKSRFYDGQT